MVECNIDLGSVTLATLQQMEDGARMVLLNKKPFRGFQRRVAESCDVDPSIVSKVCSGAAVSAKVAKAIEQELRKIRRSAKQDTENQEQRKSA